MRDMFIQNYGIHVESLRRKYSWTEPLCSNSVTTGPYSYYVQSWSCIHSDSVLGGMYLCSELYGELCECCTVYQSEHNIIGNSITFIQQLMVFFEVKRGKKSFPTIGEGKYPWKHNMLSLQKVLQQAALGQTDQFEWNIKWNPISSPTHMSMKYAFMAKSLNREV